MKRFCALQDNLLDVNSNRISKASLGIIVQSNLFGQAGDILGSIKDATMYRLCRIFMASKTYCWTSSAV